MADYKNSLVGKYLIALTSTKTNGLPAIVATFDYYGGLVPARRFVQSQKNTISLSAHNNNCFARFEKAENAFLYEIKNKDGEILEIGKFEIIVLAEKNFRNV